MKKRFTEEQIIRAIKKQEAGAKTEDICRNFGISIVTLNSFLQMIEQDASHSLTVAATNRPGILDHALLRRFDDILHYELPDDEHIAAVLQSKLGEKAAKGVAWQHLATEAKGLSYTELVRACYETLKQALMKEQETVSETDIRQAIRDRCRMADRFKNNAR